MNLTSILGLSDADKDVKSGDKSSRKFNAFIKNRIGVGVGFIISIVMVYLVVTIITIYNLLVSL